MSNVFQKKLNKKKSKANEITFLQHEVIKLLSVHPCSHELFSGAHHLLWLLLGKTWVNSEIIMCYLNWRPNVLLVGGQNG